MHVISAGNSADHDNHMTIARPWVARVEFNKQESDILGVTWLAGDRLVQLLHVPELQRFITLSKSKPDRRPSSKKCPAVFAVSRLSVAKATACFNTSGCERRPAFKMAAALRNAPASFRFSQATPGGAAPPSAGAQMPVKVLSKSSRSA